MEKEDMNNKTDDKTPGFIYMRKFHFVVLIFAIIFVSAGITTIALAFGDEKAVPVVNEREEFKKLYEAYDMIKENYFQEVDEVTLVNGAINGMVEALEDPYSDYMNEEEAASFNEGISSSFEGIGAEVQEQDGYIVIVSPIKGSPAEKAGLKPNDKILSADGQSLQGMSASEAVLLIRGEKGTKVKLMIERPGVSEPFEVSITRDTIPIETVYGEMVEDKIGKIQITSFSENTMNELLEVLEDLKEQGMEGLILDLRSNPGGLLEQAIQISSLFVPEGEVLFQIEDRNGNREEMTSSNTNFEEIPLVVVIDKGSASASEILAGAVSESAGVPLVGETTFGKGTVQRAQEFSDGSNLKYTTEKWLTPKGNWIHEKGIKPDHEVSLPDYASISIIDPDEKWELSTSSAQVKSIQQMLKALGYDPGREDGFFDDQTEEAVKQFQKDEEIEVNGIVTGETSTKLMEKMREHIQENDTQIEKAIEVLQEQMK